MDTFVQGQIDAQMKTIMGGGGDAAIDPTALASSAATGYVDDQLADVDAASDAAGDLASVAGVDQSEIANAQSQVDEGTSTVTDASDEAVATAGDAAADNGAAPVEVNPADAMMLDTAELLSQVCIFRTVIWPINYPNDG